MSAKEWAGPIFAAMARPRPAIQGDPAFYPPSQPHSPTSIEAAESIKPHAHSMREAVRVYLVGRGKEGATDEQIATGLGMSPSTERPRRIELQRAGLVMDSGETRTGSSGRRMTVWVAVSHGV